MSPVKRFAANTAGRDFVVGDLHGCYDKFTVMLDRIAFDKTVDRMFSVGDLGDRGPQSLECAHLLYEPWFHAVRGNHEQMAIDAKPDTEAELHLIANGGQWLMKLPSSMREEVQRLYRALPIAIEVETPEGTVGIIHAECPVADWLDLVPALTGPNAEMYAEWCIWNRTRITDANKAPVANARVILCGHTPVQKAVWLGTHLFIDTGAVYGRELTVAQITEKETA